MALDVLFGIAFVGLELAFVVTGVRVVSMSNARTLLLLSTISLIAGLGSSVVAYLWALFDAKRAQSVTRRESWKRTLLRYPALIGPAAYYLGEYRPKTKRPLKWFTLLMKNP